ncbi:hypothetical protein ACFL0Q_01840 [Thermodesulfobacteriota bacterium]
MKNVIEVFNRAYLGGVGSDSVLLKVFDRAYREHKTPTTEDAQRILEGEMSGKKMRGREMLWKQSSLKMLQFLGYGGTGEVYNVTDFYPVEKLVGQFVIFELGALASANDKRFFVEIFTMWYWLYLEQQGMQHESLKHVMVFEEFHNIVENSKKDDLIQKIFRQIRKYGTGLVIVDQTPSLIPIAVFENLHTKITFSLNHAKNVNAIADAMYMDRLERPYIGLLRIGQAICRLMGRYQHPFLLDIPFTGADPDISDQEIRGHMKDFFERFRPKEHQDAQTAPLRTPPREFSPTPMARIFLEGIVRHPFDGADTRRKRLGLTPRDAVELQQDLVESGMLAPVLVDRKKLFDLTEQGQRWLTRVGFKVARDKNQGLEHRYYVDKIKQLFLSRGWFTFKEKSDIDLVVEKADQVIAMEIETGRNKADQTSKNMKKLVKFKSDLRFIVATNEVAFAKSNTTLSTLKVPGTGSIQVVMARDFLKSPPA